MLCTKGATLYLSSWKLNDQCVLAPDQELLAVLPGSGWDNLLNEERPQVIDRDHYAQCKLSTDRKFIVPDQMEIEPIKMTVTSLSSETFESSSEYVDSTSNMINVNSGLSFGAASISGSFSWERTNVKNNQFSTKSIALRNQVRHRLYKVFLGPEAPLHKHFKNRILGISFLLNSPQMNISLLKGISKINDYWLDQPGIMRNGEMLRGPVNPIANLSTSTQYSKALEAAYLADLIIRDFGTHVITETENGAAIVQVSYLNEKFRKMSEETKSSISTGAAMENYMEVVESRFQTTHGGASISFGNTSFEEWQRSVPHNMVAVDRVGRPIYEAISANNLPELEPSLVEKVVEVLKSAVHRYYEANIVLGCLDPNSPLFDPNANTPSSTACNVSEASFFKKGQIFGGTFQTCQGPSELCEIYGHKHPLTGQYSCPSDYVPVRLLPRQVIGCVNRCETGFFTNNCKEACAETDAIWCSPSVLNANISDAYFFGGIFSETSVNPVTGDKSCPNNFHLFRLGKGLNLCASVDRDIGILKSVPFGGLYACQSGNPMTPLIENYKNPSTRSGNVDSLNQIMFKSDFNSMMAPKRCPSGYVSHSAGLEDVCQISYCMPSNTFKKVKVKLIKSPPFIKLHSTKEKMPKSSMKAIDGTILELQSNGVWSKADSSPDKMTIIIVLAVFCSCLLISLITVLVYFIFVRRRS
ncbi:hypothetical protein Ciccas_002965 [Cichlidogyrus casuarinus]|uniref:MACPF domain-containing protein n=1 Tax=Cichlidogyrus casuarinus TaxID=1844966 RepID=A0ABD2QFR5_9PLAT